MAAVLAQFCRGGREGRKGREVKGRGEEWRGEYRGGEGKKEVCISEGFQTDFSLLRQTSEFQKDFRRILAFYGSRLGSFLQGRGGGGQGEGERRGKEGRGRERKTLIG